MKKEIKKATFAGGCFWCLEPPFRKVKGVVEVIPGYAGGKEKDPKYMEVVQGATGHKESVQVLYDSKNVTFADLIEVYWRQINPTDESGQFSDKGEQYKTAIFYNDEKEKEIAEKSLAQLEKSGKFKEKIVTEILPFTTFYVAEQYHRAYYKKHPLKYKLYKKGSGRADFIKKVWGV